MKQYSRALTSAQSAACENAKHPRCTCRCGGVLHGVGHSELMQAEQMVIEEQGIISADEIADIVEFLKE